MLLGNATSPRLYVRGNGPEETGPDQHCHRPVRGETASVLGRGKGQIQHWQLCAEPPQAQSLHFQAQRHGQEHTNWSGALSDW